ncbi:MAG: hypothetical protein WBM61_10190, partial [Woeseiaceae bacterium]
MNRSNRSLLLQILPAALAILLASACASTVEKMPEDDLRTLPGRFAEEPVAKPLVAVEAYIGPTRFYLSYEGEEGLVYSGGDWTDKIDLMARAGETEDRYAGPYILPLQFHQQSAW